MRLLKLLLMLLVCTAALSPAWAQSTFDDADAQLRVRQAATAASETTRKVEALRKQLEAERQRVVATDGERDLNRATIKALEQELQSAEAKQREQEAALRTAQDARARGLAAEAERRRLEEERRRQAVRPSPSANPSPPEGAGVSGPEQQERGLGLSPADRQKIQEALIARGFDTGSTDGIFGPHTREIIRLWQHARGQPQTGFLNRSQYQSLLREVAAAPPPASVAPAQPAVAERACYNPADFNVIRDQMLHQMIAVGTMQCHTAGGVRAFQGIYDSYVNKFRGELDTNTRLLTGIAMRKRINVEDLVTGIWTRTAQQAPIDRNFCRRILQSLEASISQHVATLSQVPLPYDFRAGVNVLACPN